MDAYKRLKLEMDKLKHHEEELMFFCTRIAMSQSRMMAAGRAPDTRSMDG